MARCKLTSAVRSDSSAAVCCFRRWRSALFRAFSSATSGPSVKRSVVICCLLQGVVNQRYRFRSWFAIRATTVHVVADMTLRLDHRGPQLLALGLQCLVVTEADKLLTAE